MRTFLLALSLNWRFEMSEFRLGTTVRYRYASEPWALDAENRRRVQEITDIHITRMPDGCEHRVMIKLDKRPEWYWIGDVDEASPVSQP